MKTSYKVATYLIIIFSLIHIIITPVIFYEFTMRVGWFVGVGLMGIFLGFLNVSFWRTSGNDAVIKRLCLSANIIASVYSVLVITVDSDPQSFIAAVLLFYLTFSSFYLSYNR